MVCVSLHSVSNIKLRSEFVRSPFIAIEKKVASTLTNRYSPTTHMSLARYRVILLL